MEDHSFDVIALKPLAKFSATEKRKLFALAEALVDAGLLWENYQKKDLPVLVAGIAKHCQISSIKKMSRELINLSANGDPIIKSDAAQKDNKAGVAPKKKIMYRGALLEE